MSTCPVNISPMDDCPFVGEDYIICECGDDFSSEELLREHLKNNHDADLVTEESEVTKHIPIQFDTESPRTVNKDDGSLTKKSFQKVTVKEESTVEESTDWAINFHSEPDSGKKPVANVVLQKYLQKINVNKKDNESPNENRNEEIPEEKVESQPKEFEIKQEKNVTDDNTLEIFLGNQKIKQEQLSDQCIVEYIIPYVEEHGAETISPQDLLGDGIKQEHYYVIEEYNEGSFELGADIVADENSTNEVIISSTQDPNTILVSNDYIEEQFPNGSTNWSIEDVNGFSNEVVLSKTDEIIDDREELTIATEKLLEDHLSYSHNSAENEEYEMSVKLFKDQLFVEKKPKKLEVYKCCEPCHIIFTSERSYNLHCSKMHNSNKNDSPKPKSVNRNKKNRMCEICGRKFASNASLAYHQRIHTGERPFQCMYCQKRFAMPLLLQIHVRIHTGERPYQCKNCPKSFSNKAAINRHQRVHTGDKPYACPECGKTFTQSNSMKLHVRCVHLKLPAPYKSKKRIQQQLDRMNNESKKTTKKQLKRDNSVPYDGQGLSSD